MKAANEIAARALMREAAIARHHTEDGDCADHLELLASSLRNPKRAELSGRVETSFCNVGGCERVAVMSVIASCEDNTMPHRVEDIPIPVSLFETFKRGAVLRITIEVVK